MKRTLFVSVLALMLSFGLSSGAFAWDKGDSGFGVRSGINIVTITNFNAKAGFHVGGLYRLKIAKNHPLYFEPGLFYQLKGGNTSQPGGVKIKSTLSFLEIQMPFGYRLDINDKWAIEPLFGPYMAIGVAGKSKQSFQGHTNSVSIFGDRGGLNRFDFGMKVAVNVLVNKVCFGAGYDAGMINMVKNYQQGNPKSRMVSFYLTAGYNF